MSLYKNIKAFYNKTYMDYAQGDVTPLRFYENFYFFAQAFQVLENEAKHKLPYIATIVIGSFGILASVLCITSIYHGIKMADISYSTEFIIYLVLMIYKLLILSSITLNKHHFNVFQRELKEDFRYVCNEGAKYRTRYFENQLLTWKLSLLAAGFTAAIGIGIICCGILLLIIYIYTHEPGNREQRPLPFKFRIFDIDSQNTPVFEMLFVFGCLVVVSHITLILFSLPTSIIWARQITSKADLVIWSIQDLLDGIEPLMRKDQSIKILKKRLRDIMIKHNSMYKLLDSFSAIYKKILMYEQKLAGPLICLTAYSVATSLEEGNLNGNCLLIFLSLVVISFIPSYLCTYLAEKIISICDACWDIPFWKAGPLVTVLRPYLVLIMQKSLRPLVLQAPGFEDISVKTYSSNLAAAYSWFNMLRQSNL